MKEMTYIAEEVFEYRVKGKVNWFEKIIIFIIAKFEEFKLNRTKIDLEMNGEKVGEIKPKIKVKLIFD